MACEGVDADEMARRPAGQRPPAAQPLPWPQAGLSGPAGAPLGREAVAALHDPRDALVRPEGALRGRALRPSVRAPATAREVPVATVVSGTAPP